MQKTTLPIVKDLKQNYYLIDAKDKVLGRVAVKAATILRGKHKPTFTPFMDTGHYVIIINAEKIKVTGKKMTDKIYLRYTGYPSGQRQVPLGKLLQKSPTKVMRLAVNRMISKGALGNHYRAKLKVYTGDQHPHAAQKPQLIEI